VNYGISWSEASDANLLLVRAKRVTRTTLQRSGLLKTCYDRFEAVNYGIGWSEASHANLLLVRAAPVYWAEFLPKIWLNYGIGWSEASDANDTAKIRPFKNVL
jgi:hypothetical protein